jgi:multidrug efflux pump
MLITDIAVKRKAPVYVLLILIVLAGLYSYVVLPREAAPDIPIPLVIVSTSYSGVSPQDIETSVTMKLEKELAGLNGLKQLSSTSSEGFSAIVCEFQPDIIIDDAIQYVRDRVDRAKQELPLDAEEPTVAEINISEFPVMMVSVSGNLSPLRLKALAEKLEDHIEALPGVLGVDIQGALEPEVRLEIDPDRLSVYDLSVAEVLRVVPSENVNISAGSLETEGVKFNVRIPAEIVNPSEIDELVVAERDGIPIYLTDVAAVNQTYKDRSSYSRLDGVASLTLAVSKRTGANIIATSDGVRAVLAAGRRLIPKGVKLEVVVDVADNVRDMVADLENNILSGLILVVAVLILFMGWRTSSIVALAIPLSMLISFTVIQALGFTLNMIVLFSLVLALGMLVDNAIVIVENIYRHMQMGAGRVQAALIGTREVAWPVTTSTATTVAAFFPLVFWTGMMGEFMKFLPITLIIVLCSSLFVAMVVNPVVCSLLASARVKDSSPVADKNPEAQGFFMKHYLAVLRLAVTYRLTTLALSGLLLIATVLLYARLGKGTEFFPDTDPDRALINMRFPQGTNIRQVNQLSRKIEKRLDEFKGDLKHVVANIGSSGGGNIVFAGGSSGPHMGNISLVFIDFEDRKRPSAQALKEIRARLQDLSGAEIKVEKEKNGPPTGAPVAIRIVGEKFKDLETISNRAIKLIENVPGLINLRSDLEAARPELVFKVDRRVAALSGVSSAIIGNFLKTAIFGYKVGNWRQFNDEYDITVRLPEGRRVRIDDLYRLRVPNGRGQSIPLTSLGSFDYRGGFGTINRVDQKRAVNLTADNDEGYQSDQVLKEVQRRLQGLLTDKEKAAGYRASYEGEKEEQDQASAFLLKAFLTAVILIILILVTQFNSFQVPLIIITTVVLSLIGVLAGLLICRLPFGILMTGIGVISLAGVVVNNAIVLLDYTRQLQKNGMELVAAAIEAGRTRLRPVLLTAATTILGLIPMATGISFNFRAMELITRSQSSQWWRGMSIAVIFGLAFATVLTLVVVPALYVSLQRLFGVLQASNEQTVAPDKLEA